MPAFDDMRTLANFTTAFNTACRNYTHTTDFAEEVKSLLNARTIDNTDSILRKLEQVVEAYPAKATEKLAQAFAAEVSIDAINLPEGKTLEESFQNFVKPMLQVLKA